MKAAVFCPGMSLTRHGDLSSIASDYDLTHAVNTALKLVTTDWLSAGDVTMLRILDTTRPTIGVVTTDSTANENIWTDIIYARWSTVPHIVGHANLGRPINWSLQAALCHAAHLGAKNIDIYGCDLMGTNDATGYKGEDRSGDRWKRENADLSFTMHILQQRGVTVRRLIK